MKWFPVFQIMRPANVITAISDIIAGVAIAGLLVPELWNQQLLIQITLLIISTIGLYSGGIVFNDIFDLKLDKINRPERVIPSGRLTLKEATILGISLFLLGITSAFLASFISGLIAIAICLFALLYDKFAKHHKILGPLNMGICRGLNLILGMSVNSYIFSDNLLIALIPVVFVAAITLTAQKETKGKNKRAIATAMILDFSIVMAFVLMSEFLNLSLKNTAIFLILWYLINLIAKGRALINNDPVLIQKAVKMSVLSLIPLNASYTAGFSSMIMALIVMCLLPISLYLAKKFPVT